jgi:mono/diheme cytochrome c family protein
MKDFLNIALFTLVVSLVYTGIAQVLPQLEGKAPPRVEFGSDTSPEDLAILGAEVFESTCTQCHKMAESGRCPPLGNIGAIAHDRARERGEGYTDVEYLVESMCKPNDYLVPGFAGGMMEPQQRSIKPGALQALTAYLQSLGGEPTISGTDTQVFIDFGCATPGGGDASAGGTVAKLDPMPAPEKIWTDFGCSGCHESDDAPDLTGIGQRLEKWELLDSVLNPDARIAAGFQGGQMEGSLAGNDFYARMTGKDYKVLVEWLSEK